jgi:hypothetical protein
MKNIIGVTKLPVLFSMPAAEIANTDNQLGCLDALEAITGDQRQ